MRNLILSRTVCAFFFVAGTPSWLGAQTPAPAKLNVLFIAVDDLNHWLGYLGRNPQAATPNIDKLAARGVRFTRSYCAAPVCNPSRAALMSGMRPGESGVYDNNVDWRKFIDADKPLTAAFRKAGYFVCGAGKIYHGSFPRESDWDDYFEPKKANPKPAKGQSDGVGGIKFAPLDCKDEEIDDWAITDYGIEQLGKPQDKPFFLAVGLHKPHMPWNVPRKYYDLFPLDQIQLPPTKEDDLEDLPPAGVKMARADGDHAAMLATGRWKEAVQGYLAACAYTDMNIGRLLAAYDKSPHKGNTIIVFWGDHGWHLGEKQHWRKFALWEEAARAPLIWVVPGLTKPDSLCERTVDFMSIYPTLTDLCGIPTPAHVKGPTIRPLLADPKAPWEQPGITTHGFNNHGIRSEGWRYIRYADGGEELYNEATDPYEWTNLAADPQYAGTKAELAKSIPTTNKPATHAKAEEKKKKKQQKRKTE
ncbi:MAG TPA: sulfatase [Prosthecobacter sp.]|nr:sulfatase [Prosthecobacter sp.]